MSIQQTREIPDLLVEIDSLLNELGSRIGNRDIPDVRHKTYDEIDADLDAARDAMSTLPPKPEQHDPAQVFASNALDKLVAGSKIEPLLFLSCDEMLEAKKPESDKKQAILQALLMDAGVWKPGRIIPPNPTNYNGIRTRFDFLGAGKIKRTGLFFVHFDMVNVNPNETIFDEKLKTKVRPEAHLYVGVSARAKGEELVDAPPLELKASHVGRLHEIKKEARRLSLF